MIPTPSSLDLSAVESTAGRHDHTNDTVAYDDESDSSDSCPEESQGSDFTAVNSILDKLSQYECCGSHCLIHMMEKDSTRSVCEKVLLQLNPTCVAEIKERKRVLEGCNRFIVFTTTASMTTDRNTKTVYRLPFLGVCVPRGIRFISWHW